MIPALTTPDVIMRSRYKNLDGVFIGIAMSPHMSPQRAVNVNVKRRWLMFPVAYQQDISKAIFVYTGNEPNDISLIADDSRMCITDAIIDFFDDEDLKSDELEKRVKFYNETIKPRAGIHMYAVSPITSDMSKLRNIDINIYEFDMMLKSPAKTVIEAIAQHAVG